MNASNQIVPPQGSLLAYDKAGEMTVDNAGNVYTYDAEGRVTQVNDGSYVTTYTYDGNGQRVGKQSTMASKLYWYGPDGRILNESDTAGNVTDRFGWFNGEMVGRLDTSGNVLHFIYHDHLGSTRMVVSSSGQVQDDLDYYPFGTVIPKQFTSGNNYQFTGYETDTESSTEHAWFRNLNPNLGRYMRPDPYGGSYSLMDPQSLNRYSYLANRPLTGIDPSGLKRCVGNFGSCYGGSGDSDCANDPSCDGGGGSAFGSGNGFDDFDGSDPDDGEGPDSGQYAEICAGNGCYVISASDLANFATDDDATIAADGTITCADGTSCGYIVGYSSIATPQCCVGLAIAINNTGAYGVVDKAGKAVAAATAIAIVGPSAALAGAEAYAPYATVLTPLSIQWAGAFSNSSPGNWYDNPSLLLDTFDAFF